MIDETDDLSVYFTGQSLYYVGSERPTLAPLVTQDLHCPRCGRHNPEVKDTTLKCWWCTFEADFGDQVFKKR